MARHNLYRIGRPITVLVAPDRARFNGILTDFDEHAIYINGQGHLRDNIITMDGLGYEEDPIPGLVEDLDSRNWSDDGA